MNTKAITMLLLSFLVTTESILGQVSFDFTYQDITATIFPKEPGICPNTTADVMCIEYFDSYKWEKVNSGPEFSPLYGQSQVLSYPGKYILTVEKNINNVLCSKEILFEVHDLKDPAGIEKYLQKNGFYAVPIIIDQEGIKDTTDQNKTMCDLSRVKFDDAFEFIDLNTEDIFSDVINNFKPFEESEFEGTELKSQNSCLCTVGLDNLEDDFYSNALSVWVHEFTETESDINGTLYIKGLIPFEGESPINEVHKSHLTDIHDQIISNGQNNADQIKATYEHLRVIISNLFMPNPTGGYDLQTQCQINLDDIEGAHLLTPGQIAVILPEAASDIIVENDENSLFYGSLLKFNSEDKAWQNYHRNEDLTISNGFFNFVNAEFYENFTTTITECEGCHIEIANLNQDCSNSSCSIEIDQYSTEYFSLIDVISGGFNYQIAACNSLWQLWPISSKASKILIYDLLCAIKNGDDNFTYSSKFKDRVVIAKDITLGDQSYDYVALTLPKEGNNIDLLDNPLLNNYSTIPGFTNSFEISADNGVRLNFFHFNGDENESGEQESEVKCNSKLKSSYKYDKWNNKVDNLSGCLKYYNLVDKYKLLDYLDPPDQDNLLIMVNGYRLFDGSPGAKWYKGGVEYPTKDPEDAINTCFDNYESGSYWGDEGEKFAKRINTNVMYVDGHHSITTSNHIKMTSDYIWETSFGKSIGLCLPYKFLCKNWLCILNETPNGPGFDIRHLNGYVAGIKIWDKMVDGDIAIKLSDDKTQIIGKIDIVAHSFGYAYSKGMLDYLSTKLAPGNSFGNYYIIAPENASAYSDEDFEEFDLEAQNQYIVNTNLFESVYQYGSDFTEAGDQKCKQDGVAVQKRVRGLNLNNLNNVFIPDSESENKSFVKAHLMHNYGWLFGLQENKKGYIKPRE